MLFCSAGCRQVAIKDFIIDDGNCLQSHEVLVSVEIPFTNEVQELSDTRYAWHCHRIALHCERLAVDGFELKVETGV